MRTTNSLRIESKFRQLSRRPERIDRDFRHARVPSRQPRLASPNDPGSGAEGGSQPVTAVFPCKMSDAPVNTQPLMVPLAGPLPAR